MMKIFSLKTGLCVLGIFSIIGLSFVPIEVFAQSPSDKGVETFAKIMALIVNFFTFIALMMLNWGGQLMGTDLITGDGVIKAILPLWKLIRNMVNLIFVLMLLYMVFANIVSSFTGQGNWTIKEKLPRIIFAMIAINFSLLVMRVLIDAVNVGATVILSVADTALEGEKLDSLNAIMENVPESCLEPTCEKLYIKLQKAFCVGGKSSSDCFFHLNEAAWKGELKKEHLQSKSNQTARNLMLAFGVHFQHLERLPILPGKIAQAGASGGGFLAILDNVLFSAIMAIMYIISIGAVFVALLSRVLILWMAMIFSPAIMAGAIMGIGGVSDAMTKLVTNLIMPLKIAAAFTFSFVMLIALSTWQNNILLENVSGVALITPGPAIGQFFTNEYEFLWQIMTIVTFWMAAWWAIKDNAASFITDRIKTGAERTGKFALKAGIADADLFPILGKGENGQKLSIGDILNMPREFQRRHNNNETTERAEKFDQFMPYGRTPKQQESDDKILKVATALEKNDERYRTGQGVKANIELILSDIGGLEAIKNSTHKEKILTEIAKKGKLEGNDKDALINAGSVEAIKSGLAKIKEITTQDIEKWSKNTKSRDTSPSGKAKDIHTEPANVEIIKANQELKITYEGGGKLGMRKDKETVIVDSTSEDIKNGVIREEKSIIDMLKKQGLLDSDKQYKATNPGVRKEIIIKEVKSDNST